MKVFTVTSGGDAPGAGLTLRQAVEQAQKAGGPALVTFAENVQIVTLREAITISRGTVAIDGDRDGDGVGDVFIGAATDTDTHHFTIGARASVTLKDVGLYNGDGRGAAGGQGAHGNATADTAAQGRNGVQRKATTYEEVLSQSALMDGTRVDGEDGANGSNGRSGGAGGRGADAAGSIVNRGDLTLERVGFFGNDASGGDGGNGGGGGAGQHGGGGGFGAVGAVLWQETGRPSWYQGHIAAIDSGRGGDGGNGGHGGNGGAGGRGGDAAGAILNTLGASLKVVDVAFGGRMAWGLLADRFANAARGGDGGVGGNGGQGGNGGSGGGGANDTATELRADAALTGDSYRLWYNAAQPGIDTSPMVWTGRVVVQGGTPYIHREDGIAEVRQQDTTAAGRGGDGGDGGNGGDAGFNGAGGHAATIVNYGTVTGAGAFSGNRANGGDGDPSDFADPVGRAGAAGGGRAAQTGGNETNEFFWTVRPMAFSPGPGERWDSLGPSLVPENGWFSGAGYQFVPGFAGLYPDPDPAPRGIDGTTGTAGTGGERGPDGRESPVLVNEGTAAGFGRGNALAYLSGVRQDDDFGQLLFNVVRIGDTSAAATVTWTITGVGKAGVKARDFADPAAMTGTIAFQPIDQAAANFDTAGAGIARIALDLVADGKLQGAQGFRIVLRSGDIPLGTNVWTGTLFDGDYARVAGTTGNDRLRGSAQADVMEGREGNDRLDGKGGRDFLFGGAGNDTLTGGKGNDRLDGGAGRDVFVFAGRSGNDTITGFEDGDRVDLKAYGIRFADLGFAARPGGTLVTHDGGTILFEGLARADLTASDFIFA